MSPAEDDNLLLGLVRRHLRSLAMTLDPQFPDEDWGFTAQQAVEKLLKAWIVLSDQRPSAVLTEPGPQISPYNLKDYPQHPS